MFHSFDPVKSAMRFPEGLDEKKDLVASWRSQKRPGTLETAEQGPAALHPLPASDIVPESIDKVRPSRRRKTATGSGPLGLSSRSELLYPEAYKPVSREFWEGLSPTQQNEVMRLQAVAQEKVGFERGTQKYFIEDFDPHGRAKSPDVSLVELAAPRLVVGGMCIGAGVLSIALGLFQALPTTESLAGGLALVAGGVMLAWLVRG
jgi:hypothetical protein